MSDTPQLLLAHHLKALKLPTFLREYDKQARQCAAEGVDHVRYLVRLTELELIDRERRMVERRIRMAKFPAVKSLDSFDFKAMPSLNKMMVLELARCEYIERRENVIALGNSGTGKTHIALGLGLAACQKGLTVGFITAAALVHELIEARDEKRLLRFQKQLAKYKLLIIDELGVASEHENVDRDWCSTTQRLGNEALTRIACTRRDRAPGERPGPDRRCREKGKQTEQGRQQRETASTVRRAAQALSREGALHRRLAGIEAVTAALWSTSSSQARDAFSRHLRLLRSSVVPGMHGASGRQILGQRAPASRCSECTSRR